MAKDDMQLVILCEDKQQEVFARHFFIRRGFKRWKIRVIPYPQGAGSGEKHVRDQYPHQVESYRSKSPHLSIGLAVVIDADTHTVAQRLNQLGTELADDNQPKRQAGEKIAVFVPKRNIETWIHYLRGQPVDETTAYPKLSRESECKPDVDKLVNEICRDEFPSDAPPSLDTACDELQRILEFS
jgi:hypothetical protein